MSVVVRVGVVFIAFLALHVVFTIFRQLGDASQALNEIVHNGIIAHGDGEKEKRSDAYKLSDYVQEYRKNNNMQREDRSTLHDPESSIFKIARDDAATEFKPMNAKYTHFREKIYTIERRIFQSHEKSPGNFRLATGRSTNGQRNKTTFIQVDTPMSAHQYSENIPAGTSRDSRARVMILAYQRSGSSFLAEMFNRNPDIFYLFEPVQPIEAVAGRGKFPLLYDTLVRHLLEVIYTCSFIKHPFFVNFLSSSPFRLKSQVLKSPGLCGSDVTTKEMHRCRPVNASILTRLCSSRSHIVIKTIRMNSREILEFQTGSDPSRKDKKILASLKVVHLVRDPRAIVASRLAKNLRTNLLVWPAANFARRLASGNTSVEIRAIMRSVRVVSSNLCSRINSDMKHGAKLRAGHYAMVRYEDVATRPLVAYDEIYAFAGIEQALEVTQWLQENTKSDLDPGYYSTSRNATASVRGWRLRLPYALAREVQEQCPQLMETLGYVPVQNEIHLRDLSKVLVTPSTSGSLLRGKTVI